VRRVPKAWDRISKGLPYLLLSSEMTVAIFGEVAFGLRWYPKLTMYTSTPIPLIKVMDSPKIKSTKLSINQNTFRGKEYWAPKCLQKWLAVHSQEETKYSH
jgi:hypothetical protein